MVLHVVSWYYLSEQSGLDAIYLGNEAPHYDCLIKSNLNSRFETQWSSWWAFSCFPCDSTLPLDVEQQNEHDPVLWQFGCQNQNLSRCSCSLATMSPTFKVHKKETWGHAYCHQEFRIIINMRNQNSIHLKKEHDEP